MKNDALQFKLLNNFSLRTFCVNDSPIYLFDFNSHFLIDTHLATANISIIK